MNAVKLTLGAALAASLLLAAPADAAKKKAQPKPADQYTKEYNAVKARCEKKYGNGGSMRIVKKGNEWWCYWRT